jgi:segregation and condensation protein B
MSVSQIDLSRVVEAAIMASGEPLSIERLRGLFDERARPSNAALREALGRLQAAYADSAVALVEVASGWRFQVRQEYTQWITRLWEQRPGRYSRAVLETLALIAYRQPITRGEIEEVRGVSVGTQIMRTLQERGWVKIVGHREVPGRPALYGTTGEFLDYFNLKSLDQLPVLAEVRDPDQAAPAELALFQDNAGHGWEGP